eukprot:TRINITY_DN77167_c0_g1_i1.p2 TRINITY_DN77167_c0_g1~~TRINITY_DN77167_c0_g1_i1.p2  ORF type:complete len:102 (+),score=4.31 TRINITY_DN77167_c0_g1_i1:64-369(+)
MVAQEKASRLENRFDSKKSESFLLQYQEQFMVYSSLLAMTLFLCKLLQQQLGRKAIVQQTQNCVLRAKALGSRGRMVVSVATNRLASHATKPSEHGIPLVW